MNRFITVLLILALNLYGSWAAGESGFSNYQLGPGDKIHIQVYGEPDLTLDTRLTDAGTFSFPFLNEVKGAGMTIRQLADELAGGLRGRYLSEPRITVNILDYRDFFVTGEVLKPGGYPYQPGLTVQKAVSLAGGFSERARRSSVLLIRDKDKSQTPIEVEPSEVVYPGDVITVEESFF